MSAPGAIADHLQSGDFCPVSLDRPSMPDWPMQLVQDAMAAPSRKSERVRLASKQKAA